MTVFELLESILKAYPGATPEALGTHKAAFYARFGKREGPHLEQAFTETVATFRATARQPFPIAVDIEQHMPSVTRPTESGGKPIRQYLEARGDRSRKLLTEWMEGQGAKIRDTRAKPLYAACLLEAMDLSKRADERTQRIVLKQDKLDECFQRAISKERAMRQGRIPKDSQLWWSQLEEIAREWNLDITPEWWSKEAAQVLTRKEAA